MKNKVSLIASIIEIILGILAILSFIILAVNGENMTSWIITLLLAICLVVGGIIGTISYKLKR
jgi:uncharacterized membrane protein HdeD (DUF308 family)